MTCPRCPLPAGHSGRCLSLPSAPTCTFQGCGKPQRASGLCRGHYAQHLRMRRKGGSLTPITPRTPGRVAIGVRVTDSTATELDRLGPTRGKAAKAVLEDWAKGR